MSSGGESPGSSLRSLSSVKIPWLEARQCAVSTRVMAKEIGHTWRTKNVGKRKNLGSKALRELLYKDLQH